MSDWEKYVEPAAKAIKATPWKRTTFVDEDGNHDYMASEDYEAEARAVLATVGPLIAEDTRERMVAAAAAAVEREGARPVIDREALAIALHDSVCPDRRCEPTVMGRYFTQADAVLDLLRTEEGAKEAKE